MSENVNADNQVLSFFEDGFTRGEVVKDVILLEPGKHIAIIHDMEQVTDRNMDLSGTKFKADEDLPQWVDPTPQLAVTYKGIDVETGKIYGVMTHRYNALGYVRYSELEKLGLDPNDFYEAGSEKYAVHEETNKRIPDKKRTADARNILNALGEAAGVPLGKSFDDEEFGMVGKTLQIEVYNRAWDGREIPRVKNPKAIDVEIPVDETATE